MPSADLTASWTSVYDAMLSGFACPSKLGDSSLNLWWVAAQRAELTDGHRQTEADNDNTQIKLASG